MIPPEPGPDPPVPVTPEYTYASSSQITLGSVTGTLYTNIQYNGSDCCLTSNVYVFDGIILYDDVLGDPQCYFVKAASGLYYGVLGSNAAIGLTVPYYQIVGGNVTEWGDVNLQSSTPSDYFENVKTRNFTLTQRS